MMLTLNQALLLSIMECHRDAVLRPEKEDIAVCAFTCSCLLYDSRQLRLLRNHASIYRINRTPTPRKKPASNNVPTAST